MGMVVVLVCVANVLANLKMDLFKTEGNGPVNLKKPLVAFDSSTHSLYLFGGRLRNDSLIQGETWRSIWTDGKVLWENITTDTAPPPRYYGVAGIVNGNFMISTGENPDMKQFFNDAWVLEEKGGKWVWKKVLEQNDDPDDHQATPRYGAVGGAYNNELCFAHGFAVSRFSDMFCVDPLTGTSRRIYDGNSQYDLNNAHARCLGAGAKLSDTKMLIYGGCMRSGFAGGPCPAKDTWEWDFVSKAWTRSEDHPVPTVHSGMASFSPMYAIQYGGEETSLQRVAGTSLKRDLAFLYNRSSKKWAAIKLDVADSPKNPLTFHELLPDPHEDNSYIIVVGADEDDKFMSLWEISGDPAKATLWEKPLTPYFSLLALHGIFMVIGWGFCLQIGSYVFRYWRHKPWSFAVHKVMNVIGLVFAVIGLLVVFISGGSPLFAHGIIGLFVMMAGIAQPILAYYRCHKPDDDNPDPRNHGCSFGWDRRWVFNLVHHCVGRFALVGAVVNISLGFPLLVVESIGLWYGLWFSWVTVLTAAYIVSEVFVYTGKLPAVERTKEERYGFFGKQDLKGEHPREV